MLGKTLHLLHVDDEETDHLFLARAVENSGLPIQLETAKSGQQALRMLEDFEVVPDMILLDIRMPMMSGFEVLQKMKGREELRDLSIVMFSTSGDTRDMSEARALGAKAYCVKPNCLDDLSKLVEKLYQSWLEGTVASGWPL